MGVEFDPYHKWLGIPPEEQPADHYRLPGIKAFEDDPDVIEGAADQRMMVLRTHQTGPHSELSQQLLNEVAATKLCLLNPERRAAYDRQLQERLAAKAPPRAVPLAAEPPGPVPPSVVRPTRRSVSRRPRMALIATGVAAAAALIVVLVVWGGGPPPEDAATTTPAEPSGEPPVPPPPPGEEQPQRPTEEQSPDTSPSSPEPAEPEPLEPEPPPEPPESDPSPEARAGQPAVEPVTAPGLSADGPEQTPAAEVPDEPPAQPVPARRPVPAAAEQAAVFEQLDQIYDLDKDRPDAEKLGLAKVLRALGAKETSAPAERFVLWRKASELARDAGDGALMFQIIDAMGGQYEIDLLMAKGAMLKTLAQRATDTTRIRSVISASHQYADEAVRQDRYDLALAAARLAHEACISPEGREFRRAAYDRVRELEEQHDKHQKLQAALAAVKANPNDPEANLYLGRLYCFEQSDWPRGLPHLAQSADPELAKLAAEDLKAPKDAPDRLKLADAWWDLAQTRKGEEKDALMLRAGQWYKAALPDVSSSLEKVKAEKRLAEVAQIETSIDAAKPPAAVVVPGSDELPVMPKGAACILTFDRNDVFQQAGRVFLKDLSNNGNHAVFDGATIGRDGVAGECLVLEKEGVAVWLPSMLNVLMSKLDGFSICVWVKQAGPKSLAAVFQVGYGFSIHATSDGYIFGLPDASGADRSLGPDATVDDMTRWHHIVATYDGKQMRIYLDGTLAGTTENANVRPNLSRFRLSRKSSVCLGSWGHREGAHTKAHLKRTFLGRIDEFCVFTRAITPEEVQALYAMGKRGMAPK